MRRFPKFFSRPVLGPSALAGLAALFIVVADNRLFWQTFAARLGLETGGHRLFLLGVGTAYCLLLFIAFSLLFFRPLLKPVLMLLLLAAAAVGYFGDTFGVVVDRSMIHNLLETDIAEAGELLTWPLCGHLLLYGVAPAALVGLTRIRQQTGRKAVLARIGLVLGALAAVLGLGLTNYKGIVLFGRANRDLHLFLNPSYPLYSLGSALKKKWLATDAAPLQPVAADAVRPAGGPRTAVVLVVGETARAREFAFNGYGRSTNPQLAGRAVVNFPAVQACGTSTAESLPCLFSALPRKAFKRDKAARQENLLDILQRTGVTVLWRDNDAGSKGVAARVGYEDLSRRRDADLCAEGNCFDEILLRDLDRRLAETPGDMLVVLHMKGSHGPSYYKRTPPAFKTFAPECTLDNIQDCSRESIVNAYDNTIVYTDHVLAALIDLLRAQDFATAMLYVSDHGESLGENGVYLHGLPYPLAPDEQTRVPMIFWASDAFSRQKALSLPALAARRQGEYSHDFLFHSLLGLFDVQSRIYRPELDLFAPCRTTPLATLPRPAGGGSPLPIRM